MRLLTPGLKRIRRTSDAASPGETVPAVLHSPAQTLRFGCADHHEIALITAGKAFQAAESSKA
jgi:hypothetical protein